MGFDAQGYFADDEYEALNAYPLANPSAMRFAALLHGVAPPDFTAPFRYLELGCGQGFSLLALAAVHPHGRFHGIDFAAGAIANARRMARDAGLANASFDPLGFGEYAAQEGEGFDVIVLHGIWTWVGPASREQALAIIAKRLNPGGLVYVSANMTTGRAQALPVQALILAMRDEAPEESVSALMARVRATLADHPEILAQSPRAADFIAHVLKGSPNYFAHEMLNPGGRPITLSDLADEMARAGLRFVGSAGARGVEPWRFLSKDARAFVEAFADPVRRETAHDVLTHAGFRLDLFAKDAPPLSAQARHAALLATPFGHLDPPAPLDPDAFAGEAGRIARTPACAALAQAFRDGPKILADALRDVADADRAPEAVRDALLFLGGRLGLWPGLGAMDDPAAHDGARRFNAAALRLDAGRGAVTSLAGGALRGPIRIAPLDGHALRAALTGEDAAGLMGAGPGAPLDAIMRARLSLAAWNKVRRPWLARLGLTAP
jgi:SAM-dependent methyltransferase